MEDLKSYIESQLLEIDVKDLIIKEIKVIVREKIKEDVYSSLFSVVKKEADDMMKKELELALKNEVVTNDGWGKVTKYPSFEDLFRQTFHAKLNADWEMKRTIEKTVKEKVDALYKEGGKDFMNAFSDYLKNNVLNS